MSPPIKQLENGDWRYFRKVGGKRVIRVRRTKAEIEAVAAEHERSMAKMAQSLAGLPKSEQYELGELAIQCKAHGIKPSELWYMFRQGLIKPQVQRVRLGDAVDAYLASRENAGLSPRTVEKLQSFGRRLAKGREHQPVADMTLGEWQGFVDSYQDRQNASNLLRPFLDYLYAQRWTTEKVSERLSKVRGNVREPLILNVRDAEALMVQTQRWWPELVPCIALTMFAGLRPESEACRVEPHRLKLDDAEPHVLIQHGTGKTKRHRWVALQPNAVEWLRQPGTLPVSKDFRNKRFGLIVKAVGPESWQPDVMRHTAATYLAQLVGATEAARQLGHQEATARRHYHTGEVLIDGRKHRVTKEMAEAFFAIRPRPVAPETPPKLVFGRQAKKS